jgi:DNA-binding MarR family transcriptional regulator
MLKFARLKDRDQVWKDFILTQTSEAKKNRENSFGFLVQTLAKRLDIMMRDELKPHDVDLKIFANLMFLSEKDGVNQREIGNTLNFPEYYTSRNVDALVERGFAERRPDPNSRRSFLIYLTPEGKAKAKQLPPVIKRVNARILSDLTESEQKQVIGLLQTVAGVKKSKDD